MQILSVLRTEARNPRELAKILGKHETHISSKLQVMERMGLVKGRWVRKDGRNVKLYELRSDTIQLSLTPEGYEAKFSSSSGPVTVPLFREPGIPSCPSFVGRKKELGFLKSAGNFIAIEGIAGTGKTWLVAHFVAQRPYKEVFWHAIKGFDTFNSVVRNLAIFLRSQGKTELYDYVKSNGPDNSVKLELLTKEVDHRRNILVFDDYHASSDRNIDDLVEHLKNNLSKTQVIVISRTRTKLASESGVTELLLSGFTLKETASFLSTRGIRSRSTLVNLVQEKLHGHPLSLEFLAETAKSMNVESALGSVKEVRLSHYLWTQVYEGLAEPERALLRIMSVFRIPPSMDGLRFVCGSKVAFSIYELERKHLVIELGERYSLHDLVKEMAYRLLDSPEETQRKIAEYYLREGSMASRVEAVYHWLQAKEYEKIAKVVQERYNAPEGDPIVLSEHAFPYMTLLKTLPIDLVDEERRAYILTVIGRLERDYDLKKSVETLSEALVMAEKHVDLALVATITAALGDSYYEMGVMDKAENFLLRAADHFKQERRPDAVWMLCLTYFSLANVYGAIGSMDRALEYAHYSLQTAKKVPSRMRYWYFSGLGVAHNTLGNLYCTMGKFAKAKHHLKQGLKCVHHLNQPIATATMQCNLTSVYEEAGKFKDAEALCEKDIELCKAKSLRRLLVWAKTRRARLRLKSGRQMDAEEELKEVARICRTWRGEQNIIALGEVEMTLGMLHSNDKRWTEAVKHYKRALHILRQDMYGLGKVYQEFATMWLERGDYERFESHAKKAIELLRQVGAQHRVRELERLLSRAEFGISMTGAQIPATQPKIS